MTPEEAETVALNAVAFVLGDDRAREIFVGLTGITPDHLRGNLDNKALLAGVLDHLLGNEKQLMAFCESQGLAPEIPAKAARALGGGQAEW